MPDENILLIQTDSHDGRLFGAMGHPALQGLTPNMDRLAASGTWFSQTYCNAPLCCPSRASFWSGRYSHRFDAWNNGRGITPETPTFVSRFAESGFHTGVIGRTDHLTGAHSDLARVSAWTRAAAIPRPLHGPPRVILHDAPLSRIRDAQYRHEGCAWLREAAQQARPFMLYLGLHAPHHPFVVSPEWLARISPDTLTLPAADHLAHPLLPLQQLQKGGLQALEPEAMRLRRQAYLATITAIDDMLGDVLETLEATGLRDRTWVVFTSDHGEMAGEHRQYLKQTHFEASARVPLLVSGPGVRAGHRVEQPVSLIDLPPTLFDLAGVTPLEGADGHSLAPELHGARGNHPGCVFAEHHASTCPVGSYLWRRGDWKLIAYPGFPSLLFNLRDDPDELNDCTQSRPDVAAALEAEMRAAIDITAIETRAAADDRADFGAWRETALREGVYADRMADFYGRASGACPEPWRETDEARIIAWLDGTPLPVPVT